MLRAAFPRLCTMSVCWTRLSSWIWTRLLKPGSSGGHNRSRLAQCDGPHQVLAKAGGWNVWDAEKSADHEPRCNTQRARVVLSLARQDWQNHPKMLEMWLLGERGLFRIRSRSKLLFSVMILVDKLARVMKFTHPLRGSTIKSCFNNTKYQFFLPNHMPVYFPFHTNIIIQKRHMLHFSSAVRAPSQNTPAICEWAHPLTVGS